MADLDVASNLSDEELAGRFQGGDSEALDTLLRRYRRFAKSKARGYFLIGGDADDIEQEGMIGLFKAVRDFRPDRQSSFRAFAELCVTRQIITAIKGATRQKHQALNRYVSISSVGTSSDQDSDRAMEELLGDHREIDPAEQVANHEQLDTVRESMTRMLSSLEVDVLRLYVEGKSYQEIGVHLNRHVKSIDNALQRIKHKLDAHLRERDVDALV
ncbi:MAG TPA: RNA polymerase sporulation sigma factor SigH [Acidimicrobiales bacterium]|nr:RNA polymerase sporulation sigma factor SigH [Acidimicrobiales bacterium]